MSNFPEKPEELAAFFEKKSDQELAALTALLFVAMGSWYLIGGYCMVGAVPILILGIKSAKHAYQAGNFQSQPGSAESEEVQA